MKSVSIMEAQHNLSRILKRVDQGETIAITRRKKKIAELAPPSASPPLAFPDFAQRARETWGGDWASTPSQALLDRTRGEQ